ncbi:hypothetical protein LTR12_002640 [Friedmanniomyces endolithicus]|nr:hypothetical protein LTR12_002640 [Friedmanniomyces endolithicus]
MATTASTIRFLYKILSSPPPMPIPRDLTSVDAADGFIHLSTAAQTPGTAARFFGTSSTLWIVRIDREKLEAGQGELRWEESKNHGEFAHLYGADVAASVVAEVLEERRTEGEEWQELLGNLQT